MKVRPSMQNPNRKNKIEFPIIADDQVLTPDNRVIMTNQELLTNNPGISTDQQSVKQDTVSQSYSDISEDMSVQDTFETRRQMPTTEGKRPLGKASRTNLDFNIKRKSTVVEDARKRARENAVQPKPIKAYVSPLERTDSDELGIKGLANKKVANTQHSLGQTTTDLSKTGRDILSKATDEDYFASKHQQHEQVDTTQ